MEKADLWDGEEPLRSAPSKKRRVWWAILLIAILCLVALSAVSLISPIFSRYAASGLIDRYVKSSQPTAVSHRIESVSLYHHCCDETLPSDWARANIARFSVEVTLSDGTVSHETIDLEDNRPEIDQYGNFGSGAANPFPGQQRWKVSGSYAQDEQAPDLESDSL